MNEDNSDNVSRVMSEDEIEYYAQMYYESLNYNVFHEMRLRELADLEYEACRANPDYDDILHYHSVYDTKWETTMLYDFDVTVNFDTMAVQGVQFSNLLDATLSALLSQFLMKHKEWITTASVLHMLLHEAVMNVKRYSKSHEYKQIGTFQDIIKTSGHLQTLLLKIPSIPVYDEISLDINSNSMEDKFIIQYNAKIFLSPAVAKGIKIYRNHGFTYDYYEPNSYDEELTQEISKFLQKKETVNEQIINIYNWRTFHEFHIKMTMNEKTYGRIYSIPPFSIDNL